MLVKDIMKIEDRIFELSESMFGIEIVEAIVAEFGIEQDEAWDRVAKAYAEGNTYHRVLVRQALERLDKINFI